MTTTKQQRVDALMARRIDWPVPREAVRMIANEEDCRLEAYLCPAGVWTCGWGETDGVVQGMVWTQDYADERFRQSLFQWGQAVRGMLTAPTSDNEFSALLSLSYNIGLAGLRGSTVLRQHNAGNKAAAARAFRLWNKARVNGQLQELDALKGRRLREEAMYLGDLGGTSAQAVEAESSLAKSPIAQGGVATVLAGVATAVSDQFEAVGAALAPLAGLIERVTGLPPAGMFGVLIAVAGLAVVHWRAKQRREGWS